MATSSSFVVPSSSPGTPGTDPFAQAAADAFTAAQAASETYTPLSGPAVTVKVLYERGTETRDHGGARVFDRTVLAHLLKSEIGGRPKKGETLTDGDRTVEIGELVSDDETVVVVKVKHAG